MIASIQSDVKAGISLIPPSKHRKGSHRMRTSAFVTFMSRYAAEFGRPDPSGRGIKRGERPVVYLPATLTSLVLHQEYVNAMDGLGMECLNYTLFLQAWKARLPHIRIRKPNTDVCEICLWYRARPMDEGKAIHLGHVKTQRDALNSTIRDSRLPLFSHTVQLTFGFAERVLLPMFADTPTDIYFKAGLKVDLFGVDNTTQVQTNYVLPEGKWPGEKGVNAIASMLYRDVVANHADKTTIHYMADISSGQNKSRFMIWFLSFLSTTLNKTFHLRFLIAGHSKNFRDACFGLCKRSLKGKNVFTPNDVVNCYDSSGRCNTVATASGAVFYDWRTFLDQFYSGTIDYISKMHEFRFTPDEPGIVSYKRFHISSSGDGAGDWMAQRLWRKSVYAQSLCDPTGAGLRPLSSFVVPPSTYSLESRIVYPGLTRKQYLQREIVDHYFVGERAGHASLYFEDGSSTPEETPP